MTTETKLGLENIQSVYFIGIGGIGMSALARWFRAKGYEVGGYDRQASPITAALQELGIAIHFEDDIQHIPQNFRPAFAEDKEKVLVVYTPAIPKNHQEYNYFLKEGFQVAKRSKVLGLVTAQHFTIAVAGTHGKTTTSSMIAHILIQVGKPCTAFLGGVLQNYNSNLLINTESIENSLVVVEADEYDRSFLELRPNYLVVTAMDADHLDIYGDKSSMDATYFEFIKKIEPDGRFFGKKDLVLWLDEFEGSFEKQNYSISEEADYYADNIQIIEGSFYFDFISDVHKIGQVTLQMAGYHNVENAVAAIAVCLNLGIDAKEIKQALASYRGVKRRFEYIFRHPERVFIDDYAHHPVEIEALLRSVRSMYPQKKITAIFQPHLYTRTRDFADDFAQSLNMADELILLDIYPARELPIEGVSSKLILDKVSINNKVLTSKDNLLNLIKSKKLEVLVTIGAGDIAQMIDAIKQTLAKQ